MLEALLSQHPIAGVVLEHRHVAKLLTGFIASIKAHLDRVPRVPTADGKVRAGWSMRATAQTRRLLPSSNMLHLYARPTEPMGLLQELRPYHCGPLVLWPVTSCSSTYKLTLLLTHQSNISLGCSASELAERKPCAFCDRPCANGRCSCGDLRGGTTRPARRRGGCPCPNPTSCACPSRASWWCR